MKIVIILVLLLSNIYSKEIKMCIKTPDELKEMFENFTGEEVDISDDEVFAEGDSRSIVMYPLNKSERFFESYGKIHIITTDGDLSYCTGNIVTKNYYYSSSQMRKKSGLDSSNYDADDLPDEQNDIVLSADHCFRDKKSKKLDDIDYDKSYIVFTTAHKRKIKRKFKLIATVDSTKSLADASVLQLDRPIKRDVIYPLVYDGGITEFYTDSEYENREVIDMYAAGYSSDKYKGNGGKNLTYEKNCIDCYLSEIQTNCKAYYGASGGAAVVKVKETYPHETLVKDYFIGTNKAISLIYVGKLYITRKNYIDEELEFQGASIYELLGYEEEW